MHTLLERQLRRAGFSYDTLPTDITTWQEFLSRIDRSYLNADRERQLREQETCESVPSTATPDVVLKQKTLQLDSVLTAISGGLCAFDQQGQLLFLNPTAKEYLNIQNDQCSLVTILEHFEIHQKNSAEIVSTIQLTNCLANGTSYQDSSAILKLKDISLPIAFILNPIIKDKQFIGSVLLFNDISEMKAVESDLIAAKEFAEKASHAKSQFLSSMSHELRTPMNAILGYSELLKEDLSSPPSEIDEDAVDDMQQYVANILQAGWHLLELINKVLDLTRIEAGKLEVLIEKVELIDLIKECVSLITPLAEKRDISIYNKTATMRPQEALIDRARLKQVLINLLSNAVKYNQESGSIEINLNQTNPEYIRISVTDTGIGLSEEQKNKVFDPFTRLSGLNLIEGTGIGLTITKRLLEIMDGKIGLDSTLGVGSTFWIEVPTGEVAATDNGLAISRSEHHKFIMLYIEDSRTNVSLVAQILKARPEIALMSAHTGEMGLELAHLHHPDLILLDINLPGMDGFEVFKSLRSTEDTKNIPVLALSANDTARNLERGREAGFASYIIKPLDIKQFLESIDSVLTAQ